MGTTNLHVKIRSPSPSHQLKAIPSSPQPQFTPPSKQNRFEIVIGKEIQIIPNKSVDVFVIHIFGTIHLSYTVQVIQGKHTSINPF